MDDDPRSGRRCTIDHRAIVAVTLKPPPKKFGVTHWSSRLLGRSLGVSNGTIAKAWRDYGTSTLFAALEIATGKVTGACRPRHRHQEFLAFLGQVARAYPDTATAPSCTW